MFRACPFGREGGGGRETKMAVGDKDGGGHGGIGSGTGDDVEVPDVKLTNIERQYNSWRRYTTHQCNVVDANLNEVQVHFPC